MAEDIPAALEPPEITSSEVSTPLSEDLELDVMGIDISFHGKIFNLKVAKDMTISELSLTLSEIVSVDSSKQKIMITPRPGLLKPPFPDTLLTDILTPKSKITLLGTTDKEINDLNLLVANNRMLQLRGGRGTVKAAKPAKYRDWRKVQEESQYTFHMIRPLPYLPNPDRSTRFLERLRDDPGIKAAMRAHKFSVPLLTEMNPAEHTTRESKTLGLNRNKGEVIELRLRTDAYDGYRDYKVIRKTLCHELAHCVWGDHDRNFWDLTNQIEKEVERADWKHGGHRLTENEFYNPEDQGDSGEHVDGGGWTGGEFVLGSTEAGASSTAGLSRREILANAALRRMEKQKDVASRAKGDPANGSEGATS